MAIPSALGFVGMMAGKVQGLAVDIAKRPHGIDLGFHGYQHAADIGMLDNSRGAGLRGADRLALAPFQRVGHGVLIGPFGDGQAFDPDSQARGVHHGEHTAHALVFFAQQIADCALVVAKAHDRRGRGMDTQFFFQIDAAKVVTLAQVSVGVDEKFRHHEQRDTLGTLGAAGGTGQHQVNDIFGEVVFTVGNKDFLPLDAPGPVADRRGLATQGADIRAGLGLGQIHGPGPLSGD